MLAVVPQFPALDLHRTWTPIAKAIEASTGRPVRLREGFIISWRLPDGSIHQEQEAANTRLVLLHTSDGGFALRRFQFG